MQETTRASPPSGSRTPETPGRPVRSVFGQEFRLICPICVQDLKQPRQLLTCFHIFCAECIRPYIETSNGSVCCPASGCKMKCSQEVSFALNTDTYLHAFSGQLIMYAESGNLYCSDANHDEPIPTAAVFCLDCKKNFCDGCHANHNGNEDFSGHYCLKLYPWSTTMTVGMNRAPKRINIVATGGDDVDTRGKRFICPICRNTDICDHEKWLADLSDKTFLEKDVCSEPDHATENKLIAYCTKCDLPICAKCSMIEHKSHDTVNISRAKEDKLLKLRGLKKEIEFRLEIFDDAYKSADKAADYFEYHVQQTTQEMIKRKGQLMDKVEDSFRVAYSVIEQTGQKQSELNSQSLEMLKEAEFLKAAVNLAEEMSKDATPAVAVVRACRCLDMILEAMMGRDSKEKNDYVFPQRIVEKRLVLPAPNCMSPDLHILQKVGVEGSILRKSFVLKAEVELLQFYSILPLTETEALVSCLTDAHKSSVVQYGYIDIKNSIQLKESGQYSIIAVPGNGIVATFYKAGKSRKDSKREVLFWDQALNRSIGEQEALNAEENLKPFTTTKLPPRGLAVTRENNLVICTSEDIKGEGVQETTSSIILMTLRGDVIKEKSLLDATHGRSGLHYFPRYVTVNINGDICVTDAKQNVVYVFNGDIALQMTIKNPYENDELNKKFDPMGICHDSFGRLIVADANNHRVLRFVVDERQGNPQVEVILKNGRNDVSDLNYPTLVALGQGPKLWVVCRDKIHVFDYLDKE